MAPPRVDLFTSIHKSLRHVMYETGGRLERTNFADPEDRQRALSALERTLGFLDEHVVLEDGHIAPLVKAAAPQLAQVLGAQHREHEHTSKTLGELGCSLQGASNAEAVELGVRLCKTYNGMVADQCLHMNLEEREATPALHAAYDDMALMKTRAALQATVPPPRYVQWLEIMLPNLNHQELVGMLTGLKANAAPEVYTQVCELAQPLLGHRWTAVQAALPG